MGRVNIEIEPETHKKLKIECAIKEKTIQEYINELLKRVLKKDAK
jgi:predicted HicB family RNase H-like nuclease